MEQTATTDIEALVKEAKNWLKNQESHWYLEVDVEGPSKTTNTLNKTQLTELPNDSPENYIEDTIRDWQNANRIFFKIYSANGKKKNGSNNYRYRDGYTVNLNQQDPMLNGTPAESDEKYETNKEAPTFTDNPTNADVRDWKSKFKQKDKELQREMDEHDQTKREVRKWKNLYDELKEKKDNPDLPPEEKFVKLVNKLPESWQNRLGKLIPDPEANQQPQLSGPQQSKRKNGGTEQEQIAQFLTNLKTQYPEKYDKVAKLINASSQNPNLLDELDAILQNISTENQV